MNRNDRRKTPNRRYFRSQFVACPLYQVPDHSSFILNDAAYPPKNESTSTRFYKTKKSKLQVEMQSKRPADVGFLCDNVDELGDTIKRTPCINVLNSTK